MNGVTDEHKPLLEKKTVAKRGKAFALDCPEEFRHSILNLLWWTETQRQKHRLSYEYYNQRWIWWMSLPISFIAFATGILSFLATSEAFADNEELTRTLSLVAGCLGVLTAFYNAVQGSLKWDSSAQMHKSAARQMENLWFRLWELGSGGALSDDVDKGKQSKDYESNISILSNAIVEINDSCTSVHPVNIHEAFAVLEVRLNKLINSIKADDGLNELYPTNTELYIAAATELAGVISDHRVFLIWAFPFVTPSPKNAVDLAMKQIGINEQS